MPNYFSTSLSPLVQRKRPIPDHQQSRSKKNLMNEQR